MFGFFHLLYAISVLFLFYFISFAFVLFCFFIAKENVSHGTESEIDKSYAHTHMHSLTHRERAERLKLLAEDNRIGFGWVCARLSSCMCVHVVRVYMCLHTENRVNATEKKRDQVNIKCFKVYVTECGSWLVRRPAQPLHLLLQQVNWTWSVQTILYKHEYVYTFTHTNESAQYHDDAEERTHLLGCINRFSSWLFRFSFSFALIRSVLLYRMQCAIAALPCHLFVTFIDLNYYHLELEFYFVYSCIGDDIDGVERTCSFLSVYKWKKFSTKELKSWKFPTQLEFI